MITLILIISISLLIFLGFIIINLTIDTIISGLKPDTDFKIAVKHHWNDLGSYDLLGNFVKKHNLMFLVRLFSNKYH